MNIQKNILLFDSDILDTDEDIHPIELLFVRDMVTFVQDSNSFKEQIANKSWDIIFINFQTRLFLKIEDAQLDEFVQIVIASQPGSCCNVAITNDRDQISMLKEKGFSIFSKKYNIARIREEFKIFQKVLTTSDIQEYVADYHHMSATKLLEKTRNRNIVEPRQIAMYLSHHLVTKNLKKVASDFYLKNHTSTIHALRTVNDLMDTNSAIKEKVDFLFYNLRTGLYLKASL